jgi:hypothetical protein
LFKQVVHLLDLIPEYVLTGQLTHAPNEFNEYVLAGHGKHVPPLLENIPAGHG